MTLARTTLFAAFCPLALAAAAHAQCNTPGADLIVGDVNAMANYARVGGHDACMFGVALCNVGSQDIAWIASTNQHPVFGEALYRYRNVGGSGRFEQIGVSWVHHEFFPLAQSLCCSCTGADPQNDALLPGCSTVTSASSAAAQSTMGPRYDVDAQTGDFTYPSPQSPTPVDSTAGRIRYAVADVDPGALYFGEVHVVTPSETAGNRANNASHRRLTVTVPGGEPTFGLTASTVRSAPALHAWVAQDAAVNLATIAVSGGGTVEIAWRVTDLGGGWWNYEYAVHNLDFDAGLRTFEVPIPAGVALRNVGFHDVDYHSGDGTAGTIDGTDWTATLAHGALVWSTTTHAANPDGNALRWGTTYNFRFDAGRPPAAGNAVLQRFEPGTPTSISRALEVPSPASNVFCAGDGSAAACPCGNASVPGAGEGCLNSLTTGGRLGAGGNATVAADTLVLVGSGMPSASALYFQGTAQILAGQGQVFGDGLRCVGGTVIRLGTKSNVDGWSSYPGPGDAPVSVAGSVSGGTRRYQVWYRNAAPTFCTSATFNLSNGLEVSWQ